MAYEAKLQTVTHPASADLSSSQYRLMAVNSSGQVAAAGAGARSDGVLQNAPAAQGRGATIAFGGISKVEAGAAVAAGALITPDASGKAVTIGSGDVPAGKALEAASGDGSIISVQLNLGNLQKAAGN